MGFVIHSEQTGVPEGKIRYRFEIYINRERRRKMLVLYPSVVKTVYRQWERKQFERDTTKAVCHKLFEILDEYLEHSQQVKSKRAFQHEKSLVENVIKKYFTKDTVLQEIRRMHIEDFIKWRRFVCNHQYNVKEQVSNGTINRTLSMLSYFFNYCIVREYYSGSNPCYKMKLRENNIREVRLNKTQIQELVEKASTQDSRLYNVIMTALLTGMRFSEIVNLTWNEVDFDRDTIFLSRLKTKGKRARVIPIVPELRTIFLTLWNNKKSEYVLDTNFHYIQKHWKRLQPQLSFVNLDDGSRFRFHDIRHLFAQHLLDKNVPMEDIQSLLGHQDISTTQKRYAMHARPDLQEKIGKIVDIIPLRKVSG